MLIENRTLLKVAVSGGKNLKYLFLSSQPQKAPSLIQSSEEHFCVS